MAETDPTLPRGAKDVNRGRRWALIVLAVVLLLFMALNSQKVEVNLIFGSAEMPLIFALLIAACLGALVGWVVPKVRRPER
jgi:uncharacterized integral membrane protein